MTRKIPNPPIEHASLLFDRPDDWHTKNIHDTHAMPVAKACPRPDYVGNPRPTPDERLPRLRAPQDNAIMHGENSGGNHHHSADVLRRGPSGHEPDYHAWTCLEESTFWLRA